MARRALFADDALAIGLHDVNRERHFGLFDDNWFLVFLLVFHSNPKSRIPLAASFLSGTGFSASVH